MRATAVQVPISPPETAVVGYIRVSSEEQARDGKSSLDDQRRAIHALAARLGHELDDAFIFSDPGISGQTANRPGFRALHEYCERHRRRRGAPGYIVILNDSRLGRFDPDEAAHWRYVFRELGWEIRFAEADETQDPTIRPIMRALGAAQANEYLRNLKATAKRGARGAAARGLWQREAPFGYRRLASGGNRDPVILQRGQRKAEDQVTRLTPGPEPEVALVRWVFEAYASGSHSLGTIATELRRRWPDRPWPRQVVRAMLLNPAYVGDVVWCRHPHDARERAEHRIRPRDQWVITTDAHEPLVTREIFDAVARRFATHRSTRRPVVSRYPLSGLLTCATCGSAYVGGGGPLGPPHDPSRFRFYKDSGCASDRNICPGRTGTLQARWLEPLVVNAVAEMVADRRVQRAIRAEIDQVFADAPNKAVATRRALTHELDDVRRQRTTLVAAVGRGVMTDSEAAPRFAVRRTQERHLTDALDHATLHTEAAAHAAVERQQLLALVSDFPRAVRTLTGPALRDVLEPWIHSAVVDKKRRTLDLRVRYIPGPALSLTPAFTPPSDMPGQDSPSPDEGASQTPHSESRT